MSDELLSQVYCDWGEACTSEIPTGYDRKSARAHARAAGWEARDDQTGWHDRCPQHIGQPAVDPSRRPVPYLPEFRVVPR